MRQVLLVLVGVAVLGLGAQTPAVGQEVSLSVEPACVEPGDDFTVVATGLEAGAEYNFFIDPTPDPLESGAVVEADANGEAELDGTIPDNVEVETGEFTWSVEAAAGDEPLATAEFRISEDCAAEGDGVGAFVDDDGNVHEGYIEAIAAADIARGCNPPDNDRYCPELPITRGQMAALLNRALDLDPAEEDHFDDDQDSVFEGDINVIAAADIARGCNPPDNDRFCPEENVTRGQMAAFLVRAFGYTDAGGGDHFTDDDDSVFEGDIDRLRTEGVTAGCNPPENDRYCPEDQVLRDQMASFLGRALELEPRTMPVGEAGTQDRQSEPFPGEALPAQLVEVRTGQHEFHERVVFEFDGELPGWATSLEETPLVGDPSGQEIEIEGDAYVSVVLNPAVAQWADGTYDGPDRIAVDGEIITEVVEYSDFEGVNSWAIGLRQEASYTVGWFDGPTRFVVDVIYP